jgi:hypothetical protein
MVACQAESDLLALPRPQHARAGQQGLTLFDELFGVSASPSPDRPTEAG